MSIRFLLSANLILLTCLTLTGCPSNKPKTGSTTFTSDSSSSSETTSGDSQKCSKSSVFSPDPNQTELNYAELKLFFKGKFELVQAQVYHSATTPDGKYFGALSGTAGSKVAPFGLVINCMDFKNLFTVTNVQLATVIFFPSERITVFDEKTQMDMPEYNIPSIAVLHFDSFGTASFKHGQEEVIGKPPYSKNLYFSDLVRTWSPDAKYYLTPGAGFQVRFSREFDGEITTGQKFKAKTSVFIEYKPSNDE